MYLILEMSDSGTRGVLVSLAFLKCFYTGKTVVTVPLECSGVLGQLLFCIVSNRESE